MSNATFANLKKLNKFKVNVALYKDEMEMMALMAGLYSLGEFKYLTELEICFMELLQKKLKIYETVQLFFINQDVSKGSFVKEKPLVLSLTECLVLKNFIDDMIRNMNLYSDHISDGSTEDDYVYTLMCLQERLARATRKKSKSIKKISTVIDEDPLFVLKYFKSYAKAEERSLEAQTCYDTLAKRTGLNNECILLMKYMLDETVTFNQGVDSFLVDIFCFVMRNGYDGFKVTLWKSVPLSNTDYNNSISAIYNVDLINDYIKFRFFSTTDNKTIEVEKSEFYKLYKKAVFKERCIINNDYVGVDNEYLISDMVVESKDLDYSFGGMLRTRYSLESENKVAQIKTLVNNELFKQHFESFCNKTIAETGIFTSALDVFVNKKTIKEERK